MSEQPSDQAGELASSSGSSKPSKRVWLIACVVSTVLGAWIGYFPSASEPAALSWRLVLPWGAVAACAAAAGAVAFGACGDRSTRAKGAIVSVLAITNIGALQIATRLHGAWRGGLESALIGAALGFVCFALILGVSALIPGRRSR